MSASEESDTFVCPECRNEIPVSLRKKQALAECGCVVCGAEVGERVF